MVARFLVTTADERSWRTDRPVLFLGEWCRQYGRRVAWEQLDAEVVPYHWDDRDKFYRDYLYLRELYEGLLAELGEALNTFHGAGYSRRYWRILVGPWLGYFTQMLFDRWTTIQRAVRDYEIDGTVVLDLPLEQVIPNDMADFTDKFVSDLWNHALYGRILSEWTNVPCERVSIGQAVEGAQAETLAPSLPLRRLLRRVGARGLSTLSRVLSRPTDAFFISSYLPLKQDFQLQLALGQVPKLWTRHPVPKVSANSALRGQFRLNANSSTGFEQCARRLIPEQIPTLYLEGYRTLQEIVEKLPWPRRPRVIFSSNNCNSDDVFKAWAGTKIESGSPLVIGQHGGHYGTGLWNYNEEHELAIADRYLTWGWTDGGTKQYPVGALKLYGRGAGVWNPEGGILLVTSTMPRYSYFLYSCTVASQTTHYLGDQFRFASALPVELRRQLLVRLYAVDYGWSQAAHWQDRHPGVRLDRGTVSIGALIRQHRLCVATYNATTYLETLGRNTPTIIFWNPKYWELLPSAQPYFDKLKQVGIFHETPESAAAKVAEIWNDVAGWWNQPDVQEARRCFCNRFARMPEHPIQVLKDALTTVKAGQHS